MKEERGILGICTAVILCAGLLSGCGAPGAEGDGEDRSLGSLEGASFSEQGSERTRVTLGSVWGVNLEQAVEAYNAEGGPYFVEIVNYLPEEFDNLVYEASRDRFKMDLATGKGTDIVDLSELDVDVLGSRGVLADLYGFLSEEEMKRRYPANIIGCLQTGEELYELGTSFSLYTVVGNGAVLGPGNGWTMEEMMNCFAQNDKGAEALAGFYKDSSVAATLVGFSMGDYVDWQTGKADFSAGDFQKILEFGAEREGQEATRISRDSIASGTHLASLETIRGVGGYQRLLQYYGADMAVKGLPCREGNGVAVWLYNPLGINSRSECPEGAWDFLQYYVEGCWAQEEGNISGFRLENSALEEQLAQAMVQEYNGEGEPLPKASFDDLEVPLVYAASGETVEAVRELIALADRRCAADEAVRRIIDEEVSAYQGGGQTAARAAEKIQNRVQLYLDEQ